MFVRVDVETNPGMVLSKYINFNHVQSMYEDVLYNGKKVNCLEFTDGNRIYMVKKPEEVLADMIRSA